MPKGHPNPKPAAPASNDIVRVVPAPMILIEASTDGSVHFNAYGLDLPDIVDVLRRALIHLLATDNGLRIISATIPQRAAISLPAPTPSRTLLRNGRKPAQALADFDEETTL